MIPTDKKISEVEDALVLHGLKFLESSVTTLATDKLFSIVHFAIGLELMLKARLFHEHWPLVASDPHSVQWTQIQDGQLHSIQADKIVETLEKHLGEMRIEKIAFKAIFSRRNQAIHFAPMATAVNIASEQCRGWHFLHKLLTGRWVGAFAAYASKIEELNGVMLGYREYLEVRFRELDASTLIGPRNAGLLIPCPVCMFEAGVIVAKDNCLGDMNCRVCNSSVAHVKFGCGRWYDVSSGFYDEVDCSCGGLHRPQSLANQWGQSLGEEVLSCGQCFSNDTVVLMNAELHCMSCFGIFQANDYCSCGYCGAVWAGYDCSDTALTGCEFCDGHPEWGD